MNYKSQTSEIRLGWGEGRKVKTLPPTEQSEKEKQGEAQVLKNQASLNPRVHQSQRHFFTITHFLFLGVTHTPT